MQGNSRVCDNQTYIETMGTEPPLLQLTLVFKQIGTLIKKELSLCGRGDVETVKIYLSTSQFSSNSKYLKE